MVWAAVFARELDLHNPPRHVLQPGAEEKWGEWEANQAVSAAEVACGAVQHLRELPIRVVEGFGGDSDVYEMLKEMLDD